MATVTVILMGYNQARFLRQSVESALSQEIANLELLLVDNGSSDESQTIARTYQSDPRVRLLFFERNGNTSGRLNQAIRASTAEWIAFLFADDYFLPAYLRRRMASVGSCGRQTGVLYGPYLELHESGNRLTRARSPQSSGSIFRDLCYCYPHQGAIQMGTTLVRRDLLLSHPFLESTFAEGESIYLRLARHCHFVYDPVPGLVMRNHAINAGKSVRLNYQLACAWLDEFERESLTVQERRWLARYRAAIHYYRGWQAVRAGLEPAFARSCFARAVRVRPTSALGLRLLAGLLLGAAPARLRGGIKRGADRLRGIRPVVGTTRAYFEPGAELIGKTHIPSGDGATP